MPVVLLFVMAGVFLAAVSLDKMIMLAISKSAGVVELALPVAAGLVVLVVLGSMSICGCEQVCAVFGSPMFWGTLPNKLAYVCKA